MIKMIMSSCVVGLVLNEVILVVTFKIELRWAVMFKGLCHQLILLHSAVKRERIIFTLNAINTDKTQE